MQLNPFLAQAAEQHLYLFHLPLTPEILAKFSGIKYVIMQGSSERAIILARQLAQTFLNINPDFFNPVNLVRTSNFVVYRIGNILSVSHGMGSIAIDSLLHPLTKLLYYAGNQYLEYIRVGTSGGVNVAPGTVVITQHAYMPDFAPYYVSYELAQRITTPTAFDQLLVQRIIDAQPTNLAFPLVVGNSIAADDFYLGQGRLDGALAVHTIDLERKKHFFEQAQKLNILNIEMESTALAAFCKRAQIPATMIAVTVVDRFKGDQITATDQQLMQFSNYAQQVAINYLLSRSN